MEVTFYSNFSKRINSTKRPSGGVTKNILMKDPCDLHAPVLKIQGTAGEYNYFKIGDCYYFVNGTTVMPNNYVEYSGEVDAMATCADDIKATTAFVERSAVGSLSLVDTLAPSMTNGTPEVLSRSVLPNLSSSGTYVVTIANLANSVILEQGQFAALYNRLNSQDVIEQLKDSIVNLDQIITGAMWLPFKGFDTIGQADIKAGFVDTGVSGSFIGHQPLSFSVGLSTGGSASSIDSSAYRSLKLHLPFVGAVPISPDDFTTESLTVSVAISPTNGGMEYRVLNGSTVIGTFSGSCGVPIPVGSTSYNVGGMASAVIGGIASGLLGNPLGILSAGASLFNGIQTYSSTGGGSSSDVGLAFNDISLTGIRRTPPEVVSSKSAVVGIPTYRTLSLGAVSGFVKCVMASIESKFDVDVVERCNNYLNSGAWIE